ncbi:MAG: metallophosphatase family protein [Flavobacteriaceae bacterium]|nr:metallophosphatase family protein [Flavobacteriaceae bacterium]
MVKILLLSDTHSYLDDNMLNYVDQADEVWHAGDIGDVNIVKTIKKRKPFRAVYGNIDGHSVRGRYPKTHRFVVEDLKVLMTHIGGYPGKYIPRIKKKLMAYAPDLFITGHSHILKVMYDKQLQFLHINPGAAGKEGFHHVRTMVRFEIHQKEIKNLEVIELGKRGLIV